MPKYDVHVYVVVRCKVVGVEADDPKNAIENARTIVQEERRWESPDDFGDEFEGYLVDPYDWQAEAPNTELSTFFADECHVANVSQAIKEECPQA